MLGRELEQFFPVAFLPPHQALAIAIVSYNGEVTFGLLADYDSMEDVGEIAEGVSAAIAELDEVARESEAAADGGRKRARTPAG